VGQAIPSVVDQVDDGVAGAPAAPLRAGIPTPTVDSGHRILKCHPEPFHRTFVRFTIVRMFGWPRKYQHRRHGLAQ
jgi:hypothetical protein